MGEEGAETQTPPNNGLDLPFSDVPLHQNGFGTAHQGSTAPRNGNGAAQNGYETLQTSHEAAVLPVTHSGGALPRRSYEPHSRPPGAPRRIASSFPENGHAVTPLAEGSEPLAWVARHTLYIPWYVSLVQGLRREKLPPLELTSKPVAVPEIWGMFDDQRPSLLSSSVGHVLLMALLFTVMSRPGLPGASRRSIDLAIPVDIAVFLPSAANKAGGGGGNRSLTEASQGQLPRFELQQITPPSQSAENRQPDLAVEPTLIGMSDMNTKPLDLALLGNPLDKVARPSSGKGAGGGIGSGTGTGIGAGKGPGFGLGEGKPNDMVFKVGGDVTAPELRVRIDPEYTEQARVQRLQGAVMLSIEVWPDGKAHNITIKRGLGLGLDERALEAVKKWEFEPGTRHGEAVRVRALVEVVFQLF